MNSQQYLEYIGNIVPIARAFHELGLKVYSTSGTSAILEEAGVPVTKLFKIAEGRPNVLDMIKNGEMQLIMNTPFGDAPRKDEKRIRSAALANHVPVITTLRAARASAEAIASLQNHGYAVKALQEYHE